MKKYLITCTILITCLLTYIYFHYEFGLFIDFNPHKEVTTFTKTNDKEIYVNDEQFNIKGVDLGSGIPGHFATDYAISKETYKRWFKYIQDMGANTIRVYTILNDDFYNAFYEYNKNNSKPLYLIHGLWVNDYTLNSRIDGYDNKFIGRLLRDSKKLVDVIHGKRQITIGDSFGTGFYYNDISKWVIGYILGVEWEDTIVVYTDNMNQDKNIYNGKYMKTTKDASPFEALLAELGDKIIEYESKRYKNQRLVAFSNWPTTDPLDYSEEANKILKKFAKIDVEHIITTDKFKSGTFASYHIYPYYPDYISFEQKYANKYSNITNTYKEYLRLINEHHSIPVVISEFGVPSSRGMAAIDTNTHKNQGFMDEKAQGQALVDSYHDMLDVGINNAIIFSWQDEWFKRTWNTMHGVNLNKTPYWSDYQTNEQFFGLLAFDPGKDKSISYVDGDISEWTENDKVTDNLYLKYDEKFIYLNVRNYNNKPLYIPIDTTYKSGSKKSDVGNLTFDRFADFLIVIDGVNNSRILVNERYNTLNAMFGYELNNKNSFIHKPLKGSSKFEKINFILRTKKFGNPGEFVKSQTYETGKLIHGNANPSSKDYYSLADFIIKDNNIEIRIPWGLLNFSDPSNMKIHSDYYDNYGVDEIDIENIYLGVGESNEIKLYPKKLIGWGNNVTYHERLKQSYYMVKDMWVK